MVIWLFPYLPLAARLAIRPWTLIPREALRRRIGLEMDGGPVFEGEVAPLYGDSRVGC